MGPEDQYLRILEANFNIGLFPKGSTLKIKGEKENVRQVADLIQKMVSLIQQGVALSPEEIKSAIKMFKQKEVNDLEELHVDVINVSPAHHPIKAKTPGQKKYVDAIRGHDIVFGVGPAGTGKTYLAMAMAVAELNAKEVSRIILVRPAVEAGERLGFLPGDLQSKVDPYLRPLYDALYEMMGVEKTRHLIEFGTIEIAPLAYMRGRTLNDAFVILDEAQNTTPEQMKMFLTRLGFNSKAVITGDITQIDLALGKESGLVQVQAILKSITDIQFIYLTSKDVVRHELVQEIIEAYSRFDGDKSKQKNRKIPMPSPRS